VFMNRRNLAAAALAVLTLACAKRVEPRRITAEAAAAFGRTQPDGPGGTLVLDVDALRELGFRPADGKDPEGNLLLLDLAVEALPAVAAEMGDAPAAAPLARSAVLLRLVGEWAKAPSVQRLGVVVQLDPAKPEQAADAALVLLAVKEGEGENRELLQGLGAAIRAATGRALVRTERGNLCTAKEAAPELPFQVCVQPGPGFFALGTEKALSTLATAAPAPAAREPGPVLHLFTRLPRVGRVELTIEGRGALRFAGRLEADDPAMAEQLKKGLDAALLQLDLQAERRRRVMSEALTQVKGSIGKDPEAPGRMKGAVAGATTETVLDPRGEYAALRRSIRVARDGKALSAELTLPEGQVRRIAQFDQSLTTAGVVGVLAAVWPAIRAARLPVLQAITVD